MKVILRVLGYMQSSGKRSWIRRIYMEPLRGRQEGVYKEIPEATDLLFLLGVIKLSFKGLEYAIYAYFLRKQSWPQEESMIMVFVRV